MSEQADEVARIARIWSDVKDLDAGAFRRVMRYLDSRHGSMMNRRKMLTSDHRVMVEGDL